MTEEEWAAQVLQISSRLSDRKALGQEILAEPELINYSLKFIQEGSEKLATKAAYGLDIALRSDIKILKPYRSSFLNVLQENKIETVSRIFSKICELLTSEFLKNENLSKAEREQILSKCFDWLIGNEKVAVKVFAMQSIYNLSETESWIPGELKAQLELQFDRSSAAFQSRAKALLKKLKS
ncbi:hypothetical protein [Leeuwenhoekiella marinoflava]|uniref:HEAT repeat protein n=2 Tax=Leeuwenhoekiella marinoflava TaxID=988 RepID=A0A4Q0PN93_9FLAO|nr:hypothetical protein [Leeuwenhoekiella marinoflava]RXG30813.1 hypothetical protein DSL99_1856 [Leeuwenhoekiella marinoflava]SHF15663.1 hypothetical protein SAMN02745246_01801 [Leeuwenhoekiella marinoflava DSM 3653]